MNFLVKDLAANEWHFTIGEGLITLGDLRKAIHRLTGVERCFHRFCGAGRSYLEDHPDNCPIEEMIRGMPVSADPPQERIIFWAWLPDEHLTSLGRGGLFHNTELPRKQAWHQRMFGRPLRCVTIRQHRTDPHTLRWARARCAKRNRRRTPYMEANWRLEAGLRALSSDDDADTEESDS